jgi:hypothetical protein
MPFVPRPSIYSDYGVCHGHIKQFLKKHRSNIARISSILYISGQAGLTAEDLPIFEELNLRIDKFLEEVKYITWDLLRDKKCCLKSSRSPEVWHDLMERNWIARNELIQVKWFKLRNFDEEDEVIKEPIW